MWYHELWFCSSFLVDLALLIQAIYILILYILCSLLSCPYILVFNFQAPLIQCRIFFYIVIFIAFFVLNMFLVVPFH